MCRISVTMGITRTTMEEGCLGRVTIRITMVGRIIRTKGEDSLVNLTIPSTIPPTKTPLFSAEPPTQTTITTKALAFSETPTTNLTATMACLATSKAPTIITTACLVTPTLITTVCLATPTIAISSKTVVDYLEQATTIIPIIPITTIT